MAEKRYRVQVEPDHLNKLAGAKPTQAVAELVWNALDADATRVDVIIDHDDTAMRAVLVTDNGHGFSPTEAEGFFGRVGGSWKRHGAKSKGDGRMLHGKEGKGRFKALALGRVAEWVVRYREAGKLLQFKVSMLRDDIADVRVTEPVEVSESIGTGVEVRVSELYRSFRSLSAENAIRALSEVFAIYLTDYPTAAVFVENERLDPSTMILGRENIPLDPIKDADGDEEYPAEVEVIEWRSAGDRHFFLCGSAGFPFQRFTPRFHTPGHQFSAYLRSGFVDLLQERGVLDLAEMNPALQDAVDASAEVIKAHFRAKDAEVAQSEIDRWKVEEVYPYRAEPATSVEKAERQVFDIVALKVNKHLPDFAAQSRKTRAFQLRMLRQAIERGPDELQHILTEVLELPSSAQREFSKLLEEASLANIISASRMVADRLKFVRGLEAILFEEDSRRVLKERSQLHRMIADGNTWIFGEAFNLTVDDSSLTDVLRKHRKLIGDEAVIDAPVTRIDGKKGIVDLMLSRAVPQNHSDEREHLVVELKRPSVKIGVKELNQIESYAFTVAADERFSSLKTRWNFWVLSNDLDGFARQKTRTLNNPRGRVYISEDGSIEVWVKTWAEVISECKSRLRFVEDHLKANVDRGSALTYLQQTHAKYLAGVIEENNEPAPEVDGEEAENDAAE